MNHVITENEHQRIADARAVIAKAQTYQERRTKLETNLAEIISASDYSLSGKSISQYAEADAAVRLTKALEPQLVELMRQTFKRVRTIEQNCGSRVSSAHSEIDRLIEQYVGASLNPDIAGAVLDFRQTPVHKAETAVRKLAPTSVEYFLIEQADLQRLVTAAERTVANLEAIDAELQRCAQVEASFTKKLKRAA